MLHISSLTGCLNSYFYPSTHFHASIHFCRSYIVWYVFEFIQLFQLFQLAALAKVPLFLVLIKPSPKKWTDFRSNCKIIFKRRFVERGDAIFATILHRTSSCYNLKRQKNFVKGVPFWNENCMVKFLLMLEYQFEFDND